MTRSRKKKNHRTGKRLSIWRVLLWLLLISVLFALVVGIPYVWKLDRQITSRFEGNRWELPARVYSRPQELYVGLKMSKAAMRRQLEWLHYVKVHAVRKPGEYSERNGKFDIHTRSFNFPDEHQAAQRIGVQIRDGSVSSLTDLASGKALALFRLEPVRIANIYPRHNEDRLLVKLEDVPPLLVQALLLVEDQDFFEHHGVQPKSILRAMIANLKAGRTVQGGSTLTQQLVKNFFLTNEKTVTRKLNEAIMSLLLEWHYAKDEILQAYLNEIYLGQNGARAVHGFGLASQFYFQRNLAELTPEQILLLVGIAKGASYFDPRRHPERARARRDIVITVLVNKGVLDQDAARILMDRPLQVTRKMPSGVTAYPAFLELVRHQLQRDYRDEDLRSEGLSVFTTLDPEVQFHTENALVRQLARIEKDRKMESGILQGAMMVASVDQGEVLASVGGRDPRYAGFNRTLAMKRPIGSMVKPAAYLVALAHPAIYNLLTPLDDSELVLELPNGDEWAPGNYDQEYHEHVTVISALVHSYNIASVRLGLDVGLDNVVKMLRALGVESPINPYPAMLLGALEIPPIEALQMYQTIAANGYKTPLRAILAVVDQQGETLQRYPLNVEQVVPAAPCFLMTAALQQVTERGTARALQYLLPPELKVAGKTGTTNDLRDSWFAGYSGEHVAVTWVGRDDNQSTGLTGSSGALRVWADAMSKLDSQPLSPVEPDTVQWAMADIEYGLLTDGQCGDGVWLPFLPGSVLPGKLDCQMLEQPVMEGEGESVAPSGNPLQRGIKTIRGLFH
jgi:penicillin-binding protein 1B